MPTVILLDTSLSMAQPVIMPDCTEDYQRKHMAILGISTFLDYLMSSYKLEYTSLVSFSSIHEVITPFTRDFESIKNKLVKQEICNKTCLETALNGISSLVVEEWGSSTQCQIILVTDGSPGFGNNSLRQMFNKDSRFKFSFPYKLFVMCLADQNEDCLETSVPLYEQLVNGHGEIFIPEGNLNLKTVESMFSRLADNYYKPFHGMLRCGHLNCNVQLFPAPPLYSGQGNVRHELSEDIEIVGFLSLTDVASPAFFSRHLVLPRSEVKDSKSSPSDENEEDISEEGRTPSFTVLLHGSLKVEKMVALAQVGTDWYGILYSWADNKKKSNLMLNIFEAGVDVTPWLGMLSQLGPMIDFPDPPYGEDDNMTPFPVRQEDRHSYAQNTTLWIKSTGLQADIQKILRHARKLPEKLQQFYKELNRVRRAALSLGFIELLDSLSAMLDRECRLLPGTAHPEAALQLTHAASALQSEIAKDITQTITPLATNFTSGAE